MISILDLLFPQRCVSCRKIGRYFCNTCQSKIEFISQPICPVCGKAAIDGATHPLCQTRYGIDGMWAFSHYKGAVKQAIHQLKFRFVSDLVRQTVDILARNHSGYLPQFDFLTPVPLHISRERHRGFNQSLLIASELGKVLQIPVKKNILKKIIPSQPQAELSREERLKNVRGAYICGAKETAEGKSVAIIDDVATTRATLFECAKVLKRAGAKSVWGIVLAHG